MDSSQRLKLEFIDTELNTAATLIRVAELESGLQKPESQAAVRRLHAKARQALDVAAKQIEDAEEQGQETGGFRERLRELNRTLEVS